MRVWRLEQAPLLIGFVLGPMIEEYFRRAMLLSRVDRMVFFERSGSATLLAISVTLLIVAGL
jgi:TctA family transporter